MGISECTLNIKIKIARYATQRKGPTYPVPRQC